MIKIEINGEYRQVPVNTTLNELAVDYRSSCKYQIVLAKIDNELFELSQKLTEDCKVEFIDTSDPNGYLAYQRSLSLLMICAAKDILGKKTRITIEHSVHMSYFCRIVDGKTVISDELIDEIEKRMRYYIELNTPIERHTMPLDKGIKIAGEFGLDDKVRMLKYRRTTNVNFYKLGWFFDYFYGPMVPNTGALNTFRLTPEFQASKPGENGYDGFLLRFPSIDCPDVIAEIKPGIKITQVIRESNNWARILKVDTLGAMNDIISKGGLGDLIRTSEALHEKKTAYIADTINERKVKFVLIAGPSSSGKTTFANRLLTQLKVNGLVPHLLSLDDYYKDKIDIPCDQFGKQDFECLDALDLEQLYIDFDLLCRSENVILPKYDFAEGKRTVGKNLRLGQNDILVIEGIHGLNERLTSQLPKDMKFKIFISALTQLSIDDHNRISTSDARLIRRIVRDNRHRGVDALNTIRMWPSVTRGENVNIFPFQEEADAFFNSALVYELCVLKQYAEPLLFRVEKENKEYTEARRLIKFLDSFIGVPGDEVPFNSILREFIGGNTYYL